MLRYVSHERLEKNNTCHSVCGQKLNLFCNMRYKLKIITAHLYYTKQKFNLFIYGEYNKVISQACDIGQGII